MDNTIKKMNLNRLNFWPTYQNYARTIILSDTNDDSKNMLYWRNKTFCKILTHITPLSLIALIPGVFMAFKEKIIVIGFVDLFAFFLITIITLSPRIKLEIRKFIFIFTLYLLSFTLLYYLPLPGAGLLFLLTITVFSSLIYSSSAAYYSAWTNTITCACFSLFIYFKLDMPIISSYSFGAWIAVASNLVLLSFACAKCLDLLLAGLTNSLNENIIKELRIEKANRLYRFISQINQSIVHIKDEETLFQKTCDIAFTTGKFKMAWIGKFDYDSNKTLLLNQNGIPDSSISLFNGNLENNLPQDYILRSGNHYVCNNVQNDKEFNNSKQFKVFDDIKSFIILPIRKEGKIIGSFNVYSDQINFFDDSEIAVLEEAAGDISFALTVFEKEKRRKLAEEIIVRNQKLFSAIIEKSADMKTLITIEGKVLFASPSVIKILGYSMDDFLQITPHDIIHPDDIECVFKNIQLISQTEGSSVNTQHRLKHKTGNYIWCEGTITNLLKEPYVNAIVSNFRDISERKIAEEKLNIISNNLQIALDDLKKNMDSSLDIICSIDENGKFVNVSKAAGNILGYDSNDLIGKKYIDMVLFEDVEKTNKVAEEIVNGNPVTFFENRYKHKNGSIVNILWSARWDNDSKLMYCIAKDITDVTNKKAQILKSELFNRNLINSITAHIAVIDEHGIITDVNNAWDNFGLQNGETTLKRIGKGENYFDVCEKASRDGDKIAEVLLIGMKDVLNGKETVFYLEYPCHSHKEQRWFGVRVMKFETKERLIITLHTDITDRKKEEQEKEKIAHDLVQRSKNLEQFSYIVSHNLRAPIANLLGFTELMKYDNPSEDLIKTSMKGMSISAYKLDEVVKDLNEILQISTIVSENKEEVHFLNLVEDISISIDNIIKKETVIIKTDFASVGKMLSIKSYLYSIFYNLIINSIKFQKPGISPVIEIKSLLTEKGVQIIFKDNGLGIDLEKNNEKFFGLYKRFHPHVEGKGMGMFMTKTQVESLGGKISVISEVNKGAEFTIIFENNI
ncbi:MAG: PAS domain S-box protein [Bacteroidota bacterium]|nr:PAS domain S-box protein [Bacteroidota bacterium]